MAKAGKARNAPALALAVALVLSALLGLKAAVASTGVTFAVNSTTDAVDTRVADGACATADGTCTLRAAIQETNALPGADAILVPSGTYELAIPPLNQNVADTGDLDITDTVEISGAGASSTIVDGGTPKAGAPAHVRGLDRLFEVLADDGTVAFSGLTFRDGYAAEYGGAIMNNSTATVSVSASALTGNVAEKAGGAIDNHLGGAVHLRDSTLSNNFAFESASALNNNRDGALTVTNSTVLSNSAADIGLDESLVGAGAIANNAELDARGTITMTGSRISDNASGGARPGAALSNDGAGSVTVDQTTFSKNRAHVDGGAIYNGAGDVVVTRSTFLENAAEDGGAIYNSVKDGRLTVSDSSFALNAASARGGAIASGGTGSLTVTGSTFSKNSAEGWGGAVVNDDKGSVTILNSAFTENSGLNGGGFGNEGDGLVTVENSAFTKNNAFVTSVLASGEGGGMHTNSSGDVVITGGAFSENNARSGGGFGNEGGGQLRITGTRFSNNSAEEKGGGILIESGTVRMLDIDVIGNVANAAIEAGGGIAYEGDKLVSVGEAAAIENSRIRDNKAKGQGGGIDSRGDGPLDIVSTSITGNTAGMGGGIHHVGDAPLDVTRSTLSGNFAENGGGLFTDGDGETTVENATVSSNRAGQFGGGLLVSSRLKIRSSTVASNNAASGGGINNGGGDLVGDGTVFLLNTIVANSPTGGNCMGTMTSLGGNIDSGNTCQFRELSDHPGTAPRLGPLASNGGTTQTHALLADSPAQERAVCTDVDPCPPVDQRGVPRPIFDGSDIGAYESELAPGGGGDQPCTGRSERPVLADFDSWVSEAAPGANFGSDSILKVKSLGSGNQRALVHFTLPRVPPGCKLVGASLRVHSSAATEGRTLEALRVASDWSEFGVTWDNQPETAAPAATTQSGRDLREWDVLEQTRDMYAFGDHGFLIRDSAEGESGEQSFHSSEKGTDRPPELVLVFDDPNAQPPPDACPTTLQSLSADSDSWVNEASPFNNFGSESALKVKSQAGSLYNYNARALVRFPLPPLPPACTSIASATLRLDAQSAAPDRTLEALRIASAWGETDVTWNNQPGTIGPAATTPSHDGPVDWNVTAHVLDMYVSANHGFLIRDAEENGVGSEQTFNGRLKLTDGPPELVLVFDDSTPETTIDSGPLSPTADTEATFVFSSDREDATFDCSLDGAAFEACTSGHAVRGLTEGSHTFEVRSTRRIRAVDPTPASYEWTVDSTAPKTTIELSPPDPSNSSSASFSFLADEAGDFRCSLDAAAFAPCESPTSYGELAAGGHSFRVHATDEAGNVEAEPARYAWTVDLTAPETTIGSVPPDPSNSASASFSFSADEAAGFECSLDGGAFTACESPAAYGGLAEGGHTLLVQATDKAGNREAEPASYAWTIDLTAPETTILAGPPDPSNSASASFSFSADEAAGFECSLDAGAFGPCESPAGYAELADGRHELRVRAGDAAGNVDPEPAAYAWTVDLTAPETTIESGPPDPSNSRSASFRFAADEPASFQCQLDAGAWEPCESPAALGELAAGGHSFRVQATDNAGNREAEPASYAWTIDTLAPETTIDAAPPDPTNDASPIFEFGSELGAGFECQLDNAGWERCESPKSYDGPRADGRHHFQVRATDTAGNVDASPAAHAWTIDTLAPEATIELGPADPSNSSSATFSFRSEPGASLECRLDVGAWERCERPKSYDGPLADGRHEFQVRATDAAGNVGSASYAWTIDTVAPAAAIESGPNDPTNQAEASLSFTGSDNLDEPGQLSFECRLDHSAGDYGPCASPQAYELLGDGEHSFQVRAIDRAGNLGEAASYSWTVEHSPPETAIGGRPPDPSNSSSASFALTGSDNHDRPEELSFQCRLNSAADADWQPCASPRDYHDLEEQTHTFEVRARDRAGNIDESAASYSWRVDLTAPVITIVSGPADPTNETAASFDFASDEPASFECKRDAADYGPCGSPQAYEFLSHGLHTFDVRATDAAGNVASASYSWMIDTLPPTITIGSPPSDPSNSRSASFEILTDEPAGLACRLDQGAPAPCGSPHELSDLADGSHRLAVSATDRAGNVGEASYAWTVDTVAPTVTIDTRPANPTNETSAELRFTSEAGAVLECNLDTGGWERCESPKAYEGPLTDGGHQFQVRATDAAGNVGSAAYSWTIDTVAPVTTIDRRPPDPSTSSSAGFDFSADETAGFECKLDAGDWERCESPKAYGGLDQPPLADGRHSFQVRATDAAGNVGSASYSWTIDTVAPQTSIDAAPADPSNDASPTFEFSADEDSTFACKLDTGDWQPCASPYTYPGPLADRAHQFQVQATDAAGNSDSTPADYSWTIDTTAPEATIDSSPADPTNQTSAHFEFSADEDSTFACSLDGATFADCDSPEEYVALAPGRHTFRVRATDLAGNVEAEPASHAWTIEAADTAPPETMIISGPAALTNSTSASFDFAANEGNASFQCSLDGAAFADCASPREYTGLAAGMHQFRVRATDPAGNTDPTPASYSWTIDTTAPETTISSTPPALTNSTSASFGFAANEASSSFQCALDSGAFADCASPRQYIGLAAGTHHFRVRATDPAGNSDPSPASYAWTIDTAAPETTIDSGPAATTESTSATFNFSANEPGSSFDCSLDGAAFATCASPRPYTGLTLGQHEFRVRATDPAGNTDQSPARHVWTISSPQGCAAPGTLVATANADSWLLQSSPNDNYGSDSIVKVDSKWGANARSVVRFSLPAVPSGCQVTDARLRLYASSFKTGRTLEALRLGASWSEAGITWTNQPPPIGTAASAASASGYVEWAVTSQVQGMYSGANHGFLVRDGAEGANGVEQGFHSREKGTDNPSRLAITFG